MVARKKRKRKKRERREEEKRRFNLGARCICKPLGEKKREKQRRKEEEEENIPTKEEKRVEPSTKQPKNQRFGWDSNPQRVP